MYSDGAVGCGFPVCFGVAVADGGALATPRAGEALATPSEGEAVALPGGAGGGGGDAWDGSGAALGVVVEVGGGVLRGGVATEFDVAAARDGGDGVERWTPR